MKVSAIIAAIVIIIVIVIAAAYLLKNNSPYSSSTSTYGSSTATYSSSIYYNTTTILPQPQNITPPAQNSTSIQNTTTIQSTNNASSSNSSATYSIKIGNSSTFGSYLTNGTGWTLYVYNLDTQYSGSSACYGTCASLWPPLYGSNITVQPGINSSKLGTITRTDGTMQITYNGYPLYYYSYDTKPGDTNGQGYGNVWHILAPSGNKIT
jgi:predicted lipoprotein with Yx(FWY)xxD motif